MFIGPTIWPVIGNALQLKAEGGVYPHVAFTKMSKKYGNLMGIGFGPAYSLVVSGYDEIKEILKKPETMDRFEFPFVRDRSFNKTLGKYLMYHIYWEIISSAQCNPAIYI